MTYVGWLATQTAVRNLSLVSIGQSDTYQQVESLVSKEILFLINHSSISSQNKAKSERTEACILI